MEIKFDENIKDKALAVKCKYANTYKLENDLFVGCWSLANETLQQNQVTVDKDKWILPVTTGNYCFSEQFGKKYTMMLEYYLPGMEQFFATEYIVDKKDRNKNGLTLKAWKRGYINDEKAYSIIIATISDLTLMNAQLLTLGGYYVVDLQNGEFIVKRSYDGSVLYRNIRYFAPEITQWVRLIAVTNDISAEYLESLYKQNFNDGENGNTKEIEEKKEKNLLSLLIGLYVTHKAGLF
ncbi:MAG: hypothetical protein LBS50_08715 [Prevotellaceae bacterium]|nr:hypothetical protein [Prevotellaceae bacterium]